MIEGIHWCQPFLARNVLKKVLQAERKKKQKKPQFRNSDLHKGKKELWKKDYFLNLFI